MQPHGMFRRCPKSGRIVGPNLNYWPRWAFLLTGFLALAWYLIRVIPKPSRAQYPCQQASSALGLGFLVYLASLAGSIFSYRKARTFFKNSKNVYGMLFLAISALSFFVFVGSNWTPSYAQNVVVNAPIGTAKGIFPGRVAWVYNPNAAKWTGTGSYWAAAVNPQAEYDKSFTAGIKSLSGGTTDADSWDAIFKWFNNSHGRPGTGYVAGDKIAIKVNQNNTSGYFDPGNNMNTNPQSAVAVVRSLVNAGVPQADIVIGDPSRVVTDNVYQAIKAAYPNVVVVDWYGQNGRVTTGNQAGAFIPNPDGVPNGEAMCFFTARYLISQGLLKGHDGQGITFCAKNYFGITGINNDWTKNPGHPNITSLTAFMTSPNYGGKTILWMMDAMYPSRNLGGAPSFGWASAPFFGKPASSFIMSLDGVAEEVVSLDFFYQHYADEINQNGGIANAEGYLLNAARAGVGVHEHWNNSTDRQYSRNLDPVNGKGIELVKVTPGVGGAVTINTQPMSIKVRPGTTVNFSVIATGDAPIAYQWRKDGVNIPGANAATYSIPTVPVTLNGSVYSVVVSNNTSTATSTGATLTVAANTPPTATLTAPANNATFPAPATVNITANATDADGTITKVEFYNGTILIGTDLTAPYAFTWTNVTPGTYVLTAKATDNEGAATVSASATIVVSQGNIPPVVTLTAPANNATFTPPANVNITANATDADGTIAKVEFYNGTILIGTDLTAPYSFTWPNVTAGTYVLTAKATDNQGAATVSAAATIVVSQGNIPPVVTLTAPATNATFLAPATVNLTANATDANGAIAKVEFYNGTILIGTDLTAPYTFSWANVTAGTYSLTAKAYDNLNAVTTSTAANITVTGGPGTCQTVDLTSTGWVFRNAWSDQGNGSVLTNDAGTLKVTHRQWGQGNFWLISTAKYSFTAGTKYTVSYDVMGSYGITSTAMGVASAYTATAPTLSQPSVVAPAGYTLNAYNSKSLALTPTATGLYNVAIQLNLTAQPNVVTTYNLKNLKVCK